MALCKYLNSQEAVDKMLDWMQSKFSGRALLCMEHTGPYSETGPGRAWICRVVEPPLRIKLLWQ